jgi:hypothetical protein
MTCAAFCKPCVCVLTRPHLPLLSRLLCDALLCFAGPYGVDMEDSTMGVIRKHADSMYKLGHAIPPRPSCVYPASAKKPLGAWFAGSPDGTSAVRKCVNAPDVSLAYYMMFGECAGCCCRRAANRATAS